MQKKQNYIKSLLIDFFLILIWWEISNVFYSYSSLYFFYKPVFSKIAILCFVIVIYLGLCLLIAKQTIGFALFKTKTQDTDKQSYKLVWHRFLSWIIDYTIIYSITLVAAKFLNSMIYIPFIWVFICFSATYFSLSYLSMNQSIGQILFNIHININPSNYIKTIFLREFLYKFSIGIVVPILFFRYILHVYLETSFFITIFLNGIFYTHYTLLKQKSWYDVLLKTSFIYKKRKTKIQSIISQIVILCLIISSFFILKLHNNKQNPNSENNFLGFNTPYKPFLYPENQKITQYVDFLKTKNISAKNYILELFNKYDIVIICERFHEETTQWELFFDIIKDKRFINQVGNIFTEYGAYDKQSVIDSFLYTTYHDTLQLNKATAHVMHHVGCHFPIWDNTNFFLFLKNTNKLNTNLPDSLKINIYFSDLESFWDTLSNPAFYNHVFNTNRDSLMAAHFIDRYKIIQQTQPRNKALVITNFRHAFGYVPDSTHSFNKTNQTAYIFKAFPDKTANVLLNTFGLTDFFIPKPIQKGAWDKAFSMINNQSLGFDLKNTPFGKKQFDMFLSLSGLYRFTYQDIFTGFAFYKCTEDWSFSVGYPYIIDGFEKEYTHRRFLAGLDTLHMATHLKNLKNIQKKPKTTKLKNAINITEHVIYILSIAFSTIIIIIQLIIMK